MPVKPGAKVRAPDAHVLALANGGEVATAHGLVEIASSEPQLSRNLRDGEEAVAGVRLANGRRRHAHHLSPQSGPDPLEGAEERRDIVGP